MQLTGSADGNRRLASDQCGLATSRREDRGQRIQSGMDVGEVGAEAVVSLRGSQGEEVDVDVYQLGVVGREGELTAVDVVAQQLVEPGLVER